MGSIFKKLKGINISLPNGQNGKNMNSNAVLAHAVKAIQELEARIKTLEDS